MTEHPHGAQRAMGWAVALNLAFVIAEGTAGWWAHSTSLWADATHNLSDVAGLGLAWGAARLARLPRTPRRTFGLRKTTLTAALANAVLIIVAVVGVVIEAIDRLGANTSPSGPITIAFALLGVAVNGGSAALFATRSKHDINARGVFLHLLADAAVSLVVVISGVFITLTAAAWIDPVTTLLVSLAILYGTWQLLRESLDLVLDAVPKSVDLVAVQHFLESLQGVARVHDLHVWALGSDAIALTAHLELPWPSAAPAFLETATETLRERFGIGHVTLQLEAAGADAAVGCEGACKD